MICASSELVLSLDAFMFGRGDWVIRFILLPLTTLVDIPALFALMFEMGECMD